MNKIRLSVVIVSCGLAFGTLTAPAAGALEAANTSRALYPDLELVAKARGWTVEQAAADYATATAFGEFQAMIASKRPEVYAGAALSPTPGAAPTLYVKGKADAELRALVAGAGIPIKVVDKRPHSWLELEDKSIKLNHRLVELGFRDVVTSFDETTSTVEGVATRVPSIAARADEVLARLPADLRTGVRFALTDQDVAADQHAYGGMWVRDDGARECTSGWAVRRIATGTTGVTTAGHCTGINQIEEPNVGVHALTHQAEHRGEWGDIEWKTSTHIEPDDFFATATSVRDVASVEPRASITVGESICVYGRSSNSRDCSQTVLRTSISCTNSGVFNNRLVAMNSSRTTIGGDSGGGWSFNFTAYGSVKGTCLVSGTVRNAFSVADLYDEALGVRVRTS
jgi:hypothetical protein